MTEADLGTKSMPRNPLLFGMLYRLDVVEHIGSGIRRIRDLCRDHGVPDPIFDISEHWVTVTFPRQSEDDGPEVRPELGPESTTDGPGLANSQGQSRAQLKPQRQKMTLWITASWNYWWKAPCRSRRSQGSWGTVRSRAA